MPLHGMQPSHDHSGAPGGPEVPDYVQPSSNVINQVHQNRQEERDDPLIHALRNASRIITARAFDAPLLQNMHVSDSSQAPSPLAMSRSCASRNVSESSRRLEIPSAVDAAPNNVQPVESQQESNRCLMCVKNMLCCIACPTACVTCEELDNADG
jgi:hypothetical protein